MKLLYCTKCHDVVSLVLSASRACACGACEGRYIDRQCAEYTGPAVPLGIGNHSLVAAVSDWVAGAHDNAHIRAFTIPHDRETFVKVGE